MLPAPCPRLERVRRCAGRRPRLPDRVAWGWSAARRRPPVAARRRRPSLWAGCAGQPPTPSPCATPGGGPCAARGVGCASRARQSRRCRDAHPKSQRRCPSERAPLCLTGRPARTACAGSDQIRCPGSRAGTSLPARQTDGGTPGGPAGPMLQSGPRGLPVRTKGRVSSPGCLGPAVTSPRHGALGGWHRAGNRRGRGGGHGGRPNQVG